MKELGRIIDLPKTDFTAGFSVSIQDQTAIPFPIKRAYWIYDVPGGESRGGHAHKRLQQVIIAVSGSFTVNLDNGKEQKHFLLNRPDQGLFLDKEIWRTLDDFSSGAVCLVLASERYDSEDYLYDYNEFIEYIQHV